jgi:hypothetical protein
MMWGRQAHVPAQHLAEIEYHTALNPYCPDLSCDCHIDLDKHYANTGSPTSSQYHTEAKGPRTGPLSLELDDDQYEYALSLLGVQ